MFSKKDDTLEKILETKLSFNSDNTLKYKLITVRKKYIKYEILLITNGL